MAQTKAEEMGDRQEELLTKYKRKLKRLERGLRVAQQVTLRVSDGAACHEGA